MDHLRDLISHPSKVIHLYFKWTIVFFYILFVKQLKSNKKIRNLITQEISNMLMISIMITTPLTIKTFMITMITILKMNSIMTRIWATNQIINYSDRKLNSIVHQLKIINSLRWINRLKKRKTPTFSEIQSMKDLIIIKEIKKTEYTQTKYFSKIMKIATIESM